MIGIGNSPKDAEGPKRYWARRRGKCHGKKHTENTEKILVFSVRVFPLQKGLRPSGSS